MPLFKDLKMNKVKEIYSYREPHMLWLTIHLLTGKTLHYKYDLLKDTVVRIRIRLIEDSDFEKYDHYELNNNKEDKIVFETNKMPLLSKIDISFLQSLSVENSCTPTDCNECRGIGSINSKECQNCMGLGWF